MYNRIYISQKKFEDKLSSLINSLDLFHVTSAYEMAEEATIDKIKNDGSPLFYHITRSAWIILDELKLAEPDLITATFLHPGFKNSEILSSEIIEYNFGPYALYLLEMLEENPQNFMKYPKILELPDDNKIRIPGDDYLLVHLSYHLDNFRALTFDPLFNPIRYINEIEETFFPLEVESENPKVKYLYDNIRKERNKIID